MNDIYITAKQSIDYIKVKIGMPSDVDEGLVRYISVKLTIGGYIMIRKMIKVNLIIVLMSIMISGCATQQGNIYTPENIVETCGFKNERSRDFKMAGVESVNVMSTKSSIDERFDYMDFYIFESKADARRAFKKTTSWFSDIEEENDDHSQHH